MTISATRFEQLHNYLVELGYTKDLGNMVQALIISDIVDNHYVFEWYGKKIKVPILASPVA